MRSPSAVAVSVFAGLLAVGAIQADATPSKSIPVKTPAQLQAAFGSVPDGGFIDMAPGIYPAPAKGFSIANPRKGFTLRAVGGLVTLDGQGKVAIFRFKNGDRSKGKLVTFQGITFRNGASVTEGDAGGVTLNAAEARFVNCTFANNKATGKTSGGGAVRVNLNSAATFVNTSFSGNSSGNRGGAVEVVFSVLTVQGGSFTDNHVNLPKHQSTSPGGAIYVLDSTVTVSDARFERNEAGWTGGAIYAFGHWTDPVTTPKSLVTITRSTFLANRAIPDPCCQAPSPTTGGAIHVEDQSTLRVFGSQFFDNAADTGGALEAYRAIIEVTGSMFIGNHTPLVAGRLGIGGAISISSNDSAGDGAVNRRSASLTVTDSLLQGGVAPPATPANAGGCLAAEGDWSRLYGLNHIAAMGSAADNRAPVGLHRVTFADCNIAASAAGGGLGGAISVSTVDLQMESSLIFDSDAVGSPIGSGGALALQRESNAVITNSTFAHNTAQQSGGALFLNGSTAQVSGCRFLRNGVSGVGNQ
ncbi:MAG TPA: right-handed parallel beta-helix repeat-containing protein, partial [Thermoanaerobaculia bacterium]